MNISKKAAIKDVYKIHVVVRTFLLVISTNRGLSFKLPARLRYNKIRARKYKKKA